ncbi:PLC-like phosphodiesterase [Dendrothele bispora CBS 962.96]|uniref:Phosphoinositide phospholipase C n=1 Tax=Dendrothele bispora (strain CBS 962.96) TaxID=1314807 RepID=A0A4S8LQ47_DENBC|nr:PLC-like phosphodiesterase [Dendrothele bispora CBS 962.96]
MASADQKGSSLLSQATHSTGADHQNLTSGDISVSHEAEKWTSMLIESEKKSKEVKGRIDVDNGQILYESKKKGIAVRPVPLECVKEMRFGSDASYYRIQFKRPEDMESRWITIIFILDGSYKTKHFVAPNKDTFELWRTSLEKLYAIRLGLVSGGGNNKVRDSVWEKQYWKGADQDGDQKLEFSDVQSLCLRLNLHYTEEELRKLFKEADTHNRGYLDFEDYRKFVKSLKRRPEIQSIFRKISEGNGGKLDYTAFGKFMRGSQKSKLNDEELKASFSKHADVGQGPDATMSEDAFVDFLRSEDNAVYPERNLTIIQDMTRPISEYYVCSSHNTYLIGHQLVGVSTIEGYIRALLHGCRTVELDIYDGDDDQPMVFHGKTFVSKVSVRDICQAISKYAFMTSPYPIMISAEIHCGLKQQDILADIMHRTFGDSLISAPVKGRPKITVLPSPEDLRGKVLLKAKNLHVSAQLEALRAQNEAKAKAQLEAESSTSSSSSSESSIKGELISIKDKLRKKIKRKSGAENKPKMSFSLASLLVYTVGVKCHGIKSVQYAPEQIFSLSENSANKLIKQSMSDLVKHTQTHMVRVYPKGTRVNSSNYEPHIYWAAGAQVVAINWQTFDLGYMINHAMFQRNGRCGYVLKPPALRPNGRELLSQKTKHFLDLTVISAQQLPLPRKKDGQELINKNIVDPFVEVSLHIPIWTHTPFVPSETEDVAYSPATTTATSSLPSSAETVSFRTGVIKNNGFNPVWQEELCLPFDCLGGMKELIFVRFAVRQAKDDDDDEPLAVYCAPLGALEHGFRHLPLHDSQMSQHPFSTLFVEINIRDIE